MTTAFITDTRYADHTLPGHPENAERLKAVQQVLDEHSVTRRLKKLDYEPVSEVEILKIHSQEYLDLLHWTETQRGVQLGADTYCLPGSYQIARLSCGAAMRVTEAVLGGEAENGLVCARPPGHHTIPEMAMGFCLLANISIAANYARHKFGLQRILIVDYDVHHGNGTQAIFYGDPGVLFISSHQFPWYPGTGAKNETGEGAGKGATINIPFPAGVGDKGFAQAYEAVIWPAARRFKPELILVSAGFDAHWADPLGQLQLTVPGYTHLTRELIKMAGELCNGKIVFVLEGGYNLVSLSHGILNVATSLLGDTDVIDPLGRAQTGEPDVTGLLDEIRQIHGL